MDCGNLVVALGSVSGLGARLPLAVAALMLIVFLYRNPPVIESDAEVEISLSRLSGQEVLLASLAGLIWCLFNVSLVVVISFAPTVLQSNGLSLTEAAILVSVGTWLGIATIPVGGYLAERFRAPNAVMVVCFLSAAFAILWMPFGSWPLAPFVLFGILAWAPAGPIMALPAEVLHPDNRGPGMGIFFSCYYVLCRTPFGRYQVWKDCGGASLSSPLTKSSLDGTAPSPCQPYLRPVWKDCRTPLLRGRGHGDLYSTARSIPDVQPSDRRLIVAFGASGRYQAGGASLRRTNGRVPPRRNDLLTTGGRRQDNVAKID